jgi:hypothetical protein
VEFAVGLADAQGELDRLESRPVVLERLFPPGLGVEPGDDSAVGDGDVVALEDGDGLGVQGVKFL